MIYIQMLRKPYPHFIIISGSGKNVGKTHMATALIREFSERVSLLALKISPHKHDSLGKTRLIASTEGYRIFEDLGPHQKNSGQFLRAGAMQSYFIETDDVYLADAFDIFTRECNPLNRPVICESGALNNLIEPGLLIFISNSGELLREDKLRTMERADIVLQAQLFDTREILTRITYAGYKWDLAVF